MLEIHSLANSINLPFVRMSHFLSTVPCEWLDPLDGFQSTTKLALNMTHHQPTGTKVAKTELW